MEMNKHNANWLLCTPTFTFSHSVFNLKPPHIYISDVCIRDFLFGSSNLINFPAAQ